VLVVLEEEFKPAALSISLDLDADVLVNIVILFLDKLNEIFCFVVELELLFECF